MYKKLMKYFSAHPVYTGTIHFLGGIGVGILIASPFIGPHPVRWGVFLISLAVLGHLYPLVVKK